jgi:hypothetical protein
MTERSADALFRHYFWPHYPADVRADLAHARRTDANPARNPNVLAPWVEAAELFVSNAPRLLGETLTFDGDGIGRLSRALDRTRRDAWLASSDPSDPGNVFFHAVVHASAFVGEVVVRAFGGTWSMRRPMWESLVTRVVPGARHDRGSVPPFHWLLKHLSDDEIDRGSLAYRFHVHIELATAPLDALPTLADVRALPTLRAPTYDLLVKYLHKHLPALRDLGEGFLSPPEFTERAYEAISFSLLHDGRVLAVHGQASSRVEIHWLTASGFDHTDTIPCDPSPPYFARTAGDALEVTVAWNGRPHTHRIGFRGHGG